jgi:hypothetical protein
MSDRYDFIDPDAEQARDARRASSKGEPSVGTPNGDEPLGTETDDAAGSTPQGDTEGSVSAATHSNEGKSFGEWLAEGVKDLWYSLRKD